MKSFRLVTFIFVITLVHAQLYDHYNGKCRVPIDVLVVSSALQDSPYELEIRQAINNLKIALRRDNDFPFDARDRVAWIQYTESESYFEFGFAEDSIVTKVGLTPLRCNNNPTHCGTSASTSPSDAITTLGLPYIKESYPRDITKLDRELGPESLAALVIMGSVTPDSQLTESIISIIQETGAVPLFWGNTALLTGSDINELNTNVIPSLIDALVDFWSKRNNEIKAETIPDEELRSFFEGFAFIPGLDDDDITDIVTLNEALTDGYASTVVEPSVRQCEDYKSNDGLLPFVGVALLVVVLAIGALAITAGLFIYHLISTWYRSRKGSKGSPEDAYQSQAAEVPESVYVVKYYQWMLRLELWLSRKFYTIGQTVAKRPRVFIGIVGGIYLAIAVVGLYPVAQDSQAYTETDFQKLWVAADSPVLVGAAHLIENYPTYAIAPRSRVSIILTRPGTPPDPQQADTQDPLEAEVISPDGVNGLRAIEAAIKDHPQYNNIDPRVPTCFPYRVFTNCQVRSPTAVWNTTDSALLAELLQSSDVATSALTEFANDPELEFYQHGETVYRPDILNLNVNAQNVVGDYVPDYSRMPGWNAVSENNEPRAQASAFRLTFYRYPSQTLDFNQHVKDLDYETLSGGTLTARAILVEDDIDGEIERVIQNIPYHILGLSVIVEISIVALVYFSTDLRKSRVTLGLLGFFGTMLSILASFGLLLMFSFKLHAVIIVVPVVILSIGVDDMFIIVDAYDHTSGSNVEKRVAQALQHCGTSIFMTSVTDFIAFILGTTSDLLAVRTLSLIAAVCVAMDFTAQITVFVGFLTLDGKSKAGRHKECVTWMCCLPAVPSSLSPFSRKSGAAKSGKSTKHVQIGSATSHGLDQEDILGEELELSKEEIEIAREERRAADGHSGGDHHQTAWAKFVEETAAPFFCATIVRYIVMLILISGLIGFVWVSAEINVGLGYDRTVMPDSALREYIFIEEQYFEFPASTTATFLIDEPFDYHTKENQRKLLTFYDDLDANFIISETIHSWHRDFYVYLRLISALDTDGLCPEDTFYAHVNDYLNTLGEFKIYGQDVIFEEGTTDVIRSSKFDATLLPLPLKPFGVKRLQLLQDTIASKYPFVKLVSREVAVIEPNLAVFDTLYFDLFLITVVIMTVTVFFVVTPLASIIIVLGIACVLVITLGIMTLFNIPLNPFTEVVIIIALGLGIDYISHIVYGFVISPGDRIAKAVASISHHGASLFSAALTTILGIGCILLAPVQVMRDFSSVILIVQFVSLVWAFLFVPILLSFVGPLTVRNPIALALAIRQYEKDGVTKRSGGKGVSPSNSTANIKYGYANVGFLDARNVSTKDIVGVKFKDIEDIDKDLNDFAEHVEAQRRKESRSRRKSSRAELLYIGNMKKYARSYRSNSQFYKNGGSSFYTNSRARLDAAAQAGSGIRAGSDKGSHGSRRSNRSNRSNRSQSSKRSNRSQSSKRSNRSQSSKRSNRSQSSKR